MINLDNNATTDLDPRVKKAMFEVMQGNPSSMHSIGRRAKQLLAECKRQVINYFGMDQIVFTSGATEALNLAIRSLPKGAHLITSSLEHVAVREAVNSLCTQVTRLDPLEGRGAILPEQVEAAIQSDTKMIVLTAANNETGVRTDIEAIASIAQKHGIAFVVDGVALLGKELFVLPRGVTAACFSGHKIHGPQGVGCVVFRNHFKMHPLIVGGPQQHGLRGGTENLMGIVGFAKALEFICKEEIEQMRMLRDAFETALLHIRPDSVIHGYHEMRVSNTSNCAFVGSDGETLLMLLDLANIAVSHGAACSSGALEPSHVLLNMGLSRQMARASLRFSLSRYTTQEEIDQVVKFLTRTDLTPKRPASSAVNSN